MLTQPKVLIIILNYGTYEMTINLIKEIQINLEYDNYSIMVVDNNSPNESAQILKQKSREMGFVFFANKENSGYAKGNNVGIRFGAEHGYDYSWILNNDIELREKNVLLHMVELAENDQNIGCIGPMIYSLDGEVCAPYCRRPSFWGMTGGIIKEKKYRQQFNKKSGKVYRVYGCCMLLRNKTMISVDFMDERTFLYGEEDILAERMLEKNYYTYYDSDVSVLHKESASMKQMSMSHKKLQSRETKRSMDLYLKEYRGFSLLARWICEMTRCLIIYLR